MRHACLLALLLTPPTLLGTRDTHTHTHTHTHRWDIFRRTPRVAPLSAVCVFCTMLPQPFFSIAVTVQRSTLVRYRRPPRQMGKKNKMETVRFAMDGGNKLEIFFSAVLHISKFKNDLAKLYNTRYMAKEGKNEGGMHGAAILISFPSKTTGVSLSLSLGKEALVWSCVLIFAGSFSLISPAPWMMRR
jgi:hypothetical protein